MKKKLLKSALLLLLPITLLGCNNKKEAPITDKTESTIIKNATSTDEYLNKKDYKSIAYAYIYHIKESIQSYESETNGNVKAKIAFINYDIKYNSVTYKDGQKFYGKDVSTSTLMTIKNEYYQVNKEKILVSKDLKKYNVYNMEDFHKVSYSSDQYAVMGYVFNDASITKTELISDKPDNVSIKYTLDNELATNLVKVDMKNGGSLSSYPTFHSVEITLSMKRDFTPISYVVNCVYDAAKPVIGSARTTQYGECVFRKINETITIPNETFLAEQLGAAPSEIVVDDKEQPIKDELLEAAKKLDFEHGVNASGDLKINLDLLSETPLVLNIDTNLLFDINRLSDEKIYKVLDLYAKLEGDDKFNTFITLVKTFAADKLGAYADIFDNFKSVEVIYDKAGSIYLIPTNSNNVKGTVLKIKLSDVLDLVLQQVNLYNLVNGSNQDFATFKKIEGKDANNYEVEVTLNADTIKQVEDGLNSFFENPDYAMVKGLLGYEKFGALNIKVGVKDGVVNTLDVSLTYYKGTGEDEQLKTLIALNLVATNKTFDFESKITAATELYTVYQSVQGLKARMTELSKNIYVSRGYLENVDKALQEYAALTEQQKDFVGRALEDKLNTAKSDVTGVVNFLNILAKYDLSKLNNAVILDISKALSEISPNGTLLSKEIGDDNYGKINNLNSYVDYTLLDTAIHKITGTDENAWGLTAEEIRSIKLISDIANYDSGVKNNVWIMLLTSGITMDVNTFFAKINTLYNNLSN